MDSSDVILLRLYLISYCCDYFQGVNEGYLRLIGCCSVDIVSILKYREMASQSCPS